MITLGIDTATSACACALWDGAAGRLVAAHAEPLARGQAERLLPMIQELLARAGLGFGDIGRYGVTVGPGAFTGLRIGLAAARGLALAAGKPLVGVTGLEAAARGLDAERRRGHGVLVALDSRREDLYVQLFDDGARPLSPPQALMPADLPELAAASPGPLLLLGDAAPRALEALGGGATLIASDGTAEAAAVARIAAECPDPEARPADPLYIRPPDVTLPPGAAPGGGG
ncbi:MAG TPA: tRNA (adenosine(37)-N6)-threonylcarbamoyltransferase complex dimerization subunit type 1 TsaB [Azospirillaceae bacterium]|nr:tRNA (adenosine(37)-N6)-threonylcarbamoyltransferase complex dimerization subunit type 1 TsaB [Azospirillaceae bacterium]